MQNSKGGGSRAALKRQRQAQRKGGGGGGGGALPLSATLSFGGGVDESRRDKKKKQKKSHQRDSGGGGGGGGGHGKRHSPAASDDDDDDDDNDDSNDPPAAASMSAVAAAQEEACAPPSQALLQSLTGVKDILELEELKQIDSYARAVLLLNALISTPSDDYSSILESRAAFYKNHWEARPLVVERHATPQLRAVFKGLLTRKMVERVVDSHANVFGVDLELSDAPTPPPVASEAEGEAAKPHDVWRRFNAPPSSSSSSSAAATAAAAVRLLQPQKHLDGLWQLLSALEIEFGCRVWAHADLMPPACAGFGAHLAVADSFVVQAHGRSRWRLYAPKAGAELPRFSTQEAVTPTGDVALPPGFLTASGSAGEEGSGGGKALKPSLDVVLQGGDSMYIPRGWAFACSSPAASAAPQAQAQAQAQTQGEHSLFLRILTNSGNDTADLLELVLPPALAAAAERHPSLRRGLPRDVLASLGVAHSEMDENSPGHARRSALLSALQARLRSVAETALELMDAAADQVARKFISERLPPVLSAREEAEAAAGVAAGARGPNGGLYPFTRLRMLRPRLACCLVEDGHAVVYHCMDNARELFGSPLSPIEFELDDGPAIEALLAAYPRAVAISDLPHPSEETDDKLEVAAALFREGFLVIDDEASKPAAEGDDDGDDDNPF